MLRKLILTACGVFLAGSAAAEKHYGDLVHVTSGAAMPAAFELINDTTLSYCFQDVEANCYDMEYLTLDDDVIQVRLLIERVSDGVTNRHTNIWTWTPKESGYHGTFSIAYEDKDPQLQTEGEFLPR